MALKKRVEPAVHQRRRGRRVTAYLTALLLVLPAAIAHAADADKAAGDEALLEVLGVLG